MNELCNRIFDKLTYKDKNGAVYTYLKCNKNTHAKDLLNKEEYNYFISRKSNFLTECEILYAIKNDLYKRPVCEICGEPVKYYGITNGFRKTCKNIQCWKLSAKRNSDVAFRRNHPGYINPGQVPEIRDKVKDTCKERYGYDYIDESLIKSYDTEKLKKALNKKYKIDDFHDYKLKSDEPKRFAFSIDEDLYNRLMDDEGFLSLLTYTVIH